MCTDRSLDYRRLKNKSIVGVVAAIAGSNSMMQILSFGIRLMKQTSCGDSLAKMIYPTKCLSKGNIVGVTSNPVASSDNFEEFGN